MYRTLKAEFKTYLQILAEVIIVVVEASTLHASHGSTHEPDETELLKATYVKANIDVLDLSITQLFLHSLKAVISFVT